MTVAVLASIRSRVRDSERVQRMARYFDCRPSARGSWAVCTGDRVRRLRGVLQAPRRCDFSSLCGWPGREDHVRVRLGYCSSRVVPSLRNASQLDGKHRLLPSETDGSSKMGDGQGRVTSAEGCPDRAVPAEVHSSKPLVVSDRARACSVKAAPPPRVDGWPRPGYPQTRECLDAED